MEQVFKNFHPYPILLVAAAIASNPSLFSQPQINAYHGVTQNPLDSISGESDPRFDLLRYEDLNFSIKDVARMSREEAFRILFEYLHPTEPVEQDLLSEAAQLANLLMSDTTVTSSPLNTDRIFTRQRLMANSFSTEVVKLVAAHSNNEILADNIVGLIDEGGLASANGYVGELTQILSASNNTNVINARHFNQVNELFGLTTDDFTAYAGKNVTVSAGSTVDVSKWVGKDAQSPDKTKVFTFAAGENLNIKGDVTFTNGGHEEMDHALAVGAASELKIAEGSIVKYDGSNFGLGAAKSIRIVKVSLETRDHLGLGTLDDLEVLDSTLRAGVGNRVLLYAHNQMDVDGLTFSDGLGQVYMEATTLNLENVDFPSGSEVRLVSEFGGIDGIYPNFGSSEAGRVNFISGVSYGGSSNLMNDRSSFNEFGGRVSIESFDK